MGDPEVGDPQMGNPKIRWASLKSFGGIVEFVGGIVEFVER